MSAFARLICALVIASVATSQAHSQSVDPKTVKDGTVSTSPGTAAEAILGDTLFLRPDTPNFLPGVTELTTKE